MSELFRVNQPVSAPDANRIRPQGPSQTEVQVQNIPDPGRVTQANQQNVNTEQEYNRFLPNFESNYDKFRQLLRAVPNGINLYEELFFARMGSVVTSGISEGLAAEMAEYMQLMQLTEGELLSFVKQQLQSAVKYQGPIFDLLRNIFSATASGDLRYAMADMLKRYDAMTSSAHILDTLVSNLHNIAERMPEASAARMEEMIRALVPQQGNGADPGNVEFMKSTILPFLSQYVSKNGDYGPVRDLSTMFMLNLAQYENGTPESFLESFRAMMNFDDAAKAFSGLDIRELESFFINGRYEDNRLIDTFMNVISKGMNGEAGMQSRPVFENLLQSMLVNESVYMPLLHAVIPAEIAGTMMYSELWVDPDSSEGGAGGTAGGRERAVKVLMKLDIKNVGYFEMVLLGKEGSVDLQLYYPEQLAEARGEIRAAVSQIFARNNLTVNNFELGASTSPKTVSEVFPKIYERRNAVNVVI